MLLPGVAGFLMCALFPQSLAAGREINGVCAATSSCKPHPCHLADLCHLPLKSLVLWSN